MTLPDNVKMEKGTDGAFLNIKIYADKEQIAEQVGALIDDYIKDGLIQKVEHAHIRIIEDRTLENVYGHPYYCYECTNCHKDLKKEYGINDELCVMKFNHCPYCGAIMDEAIE